MTSHPLRIRLAQGSQGRLYYGWVIVGVMFSSNLVAFSANPTFGLFIIPLETTFGWSRSAISLAPTLGTLAGALLAPVLGNMADRMGARPLILGGAIFAGSFFILLSRVSALWQFYLLFGLIFGLLGTGVGLLGSSVVITQWFHQRRGRAMGIVMVGASTGSFLLITILSYLIANYSWREAYLAQGLLALVLIGLPSWVLLINRPEDVPGLQIMDQEARSSDKKRRQATRHPWTFREAVKTRALWLTLAGSMLGAFTVGGYFAHAVPYMEHLGFPRGLASSVWATFFLVGVFAKFVWGFFIEWVSVRWALVLLYLGETLGLFLLFSASTPLALYTFAVLASLFHGPFLQLSTQVWGDFFGRTAVGQIYGTVQPAIVLCTAAGPFVGGLVYDLTGEYTLFLQILMGTAFLAALMFLIDPPPHPPKGKPDTATDLDLSTGTTSEK